MIGNDELSIAASVIQDALDSNRVEARLMNLESYPTISSAGCITYKEFRAPRPYTHWETTASLYDAGYESLSPLTHDSRNGRWAFTDEEARPVRISGYSYDVNGAAADLMRRKAAEVAGDLQSFQSANGTFTFAPKARSYEERAKQFNNKRRSGFARLGRADMTPFR